MDIETRWVSRAVLARLALRCRKTGTLRHDRIKPGYKEAVFASQNEINADRAQFFRWILSSPVVNDLSARGSLIRGILKHVIESHYMIDNQIRRDLKRSTSKNRPPTLRCMITGSPNEEELWAIDVSTSLEQVETFERCLERSFAVCNTWATVLKLVRWWVMWPSHLTLLLDTLHREDVSANAAESDPRVLKFLLQTRAAKESIQRVFNVTTCIFPYSPHTHPRVFCLSV